MRESSGAENRGFPHANNEALMTADARYVLFLNPDTEIREGTFAALVRRLDERPDVGLAGVVQLTGGRRGLSDDPPTSRTRYARSARRLDRERLPFRGRGSANATSTPSVHT